MQKTCDFLIIGSGISGLSLALKAARFGHVTMVTKKKSADTATNLAQGGVAAVLDPADSFAAHMEDTLVSGAGLCHEDIVGMVVRRGPDLVRELMTMGVGFQHDPEHPDRLDLGREGGHSARRVAHAMDRSGQEIESCLLAAARAHGNITILEDHTAIDLLIASRAGLAPAAPPFTDRCLGAYILEPGGDVVTVAARVTILCTGGCGKVYLYTTNPDIATGDGVVMAYRAGAKVANLEFVQFHPTCLFHPRAKNFLISEAVRGEGAVLVDEAGKRFMDRYDPRGELATRDSVARAIDSELKASGRDCVYLDISFKPAGFIRKRFPNIYETCLRFGIDITVEPIPVVPAAHYMCGGVLTDEWGRTNLENLFALGECACTGLHGANRLASNSLLEGLVFADQASRFFEENLGEIMAAELRELPPWDPGTASRLTECVLISHDWDLIRRMMWNYVGIVRSDRRLALAARRIEPVRAEVEEHYRSFLLTPDLVELRNIATLAELIIRSATLRKESRGLHYNMDHPDTDDANWRKDTVISR
jgi:L-aspartate oxidase